MHEWYYFEVLNLIINGISSILKLRLICLNLSLKVLNLIITGIPSIQTQEWKLHKEDIKKPYYNWNTFNTVKMGIEDKGLVWVLNLIITGIPSILKEIIKV